MRQHALLYLSCNAQLTLDTFLGGSGLLQLVVSLLQLLVHTLQMLQVLLATNSDEQEEGNDENCYHGTCRQHRMVLGQLLFLGVVLSIGQRQLSVKLAHLCTCLRRLYGVYHFACLLLPVERLFQIAHVFVYRGFLCTLVMLVYQLVRTLQGQLPLLAVLGLIDVDQLTEQSTLTAMLRHQLCTLLVSFLKTDTVAQVIAHQTLIAPCRNLVHRNDLRLVQRLTGIFLHLVVVLLTQRYLTKSQIAGGGTLLRQVFILQFQSL